MPAPNPLLSSPLAAADASTLRAFERRLRSAKKSDKTVQSYLEAARLLAGWLGGRVALEEVTPADIEDFMIFLLGAHAASTAAVRFKSLQQLYGWLTAEEWIETDPMARLRPPTRPRSQYRCCPTTSSRRSSQRAPARSSPTAATRPSCGC